MMKWVDLMMHHGGNPMVSYNENFFRWVKKQLIMVYYAYEGMDFQGDPDLILLAGYWWTDAGKKETIFKF
jgi:hypothetical protein